VALGVTFFVISSPSVKASKSASSLDRSAAFSLCCR
jgi:hypothetical protein